MAEDANRTVWFGTADGFLFRSAGDRLADETSRLLERPKPIRCLCATPDGSLWIGFAGAGLGRLKAGQFARIGTAQGLADDFVSHALADGRGDLWFAGNRGLFRAAQSGLDDVAEGRARRVRSNGHGREEALPSLQGNFGYGPGAARSRDGHLWFPMRTGLARVKPANLLTNDLPPPVFIERVAVDGRPLAELPLTLNAAHATGSPGPGQARPGSNLVVRVPPAHRKLEIDYTALSYTAPENVHFRHRLEGMDEDWIEAGTTRTVNYPRLPAGAWRFRVVACNNNGIGNPIGATVLLRVTPFFWQTWWFATAVSLPAAAALVAAVRYVSFRRLKRKLQAAEHQAAVHRERARIAKDIHDDLGASLTQIGLLGALAEHDLSQPGQAADHLRRISETARLAVKSLEEIVWAVNPRNDTFPHLLDYLGQFAVDYLRVAGIRCRIDFPQQPPARALPSEMRHHLFLVVKEALHNIVTHSQATEVQLHASATADALSLSVADNGRGFDRDPDDPQADGLRNMRLRVREIGGLCHIQSQPGRGTSLRLEVPWPGFPMCLRNDEESGPEHDRLRAGRSTPTPTSS
jgi:signal transduction histidine kinase